MKMVESERDPVPDELERSDDALEREAEDEAAAEAAAIGGPAPDYAGDEEDRALEEGGEGVAEGFEESERELIDSAEHGDAGYFPEAAEPEVESDLSTAEYGEADQEIPPDG
jgi:hypothetical protein